MDTQNTKAGVITKEDDDRVREARAAMIEGGGYVPPYRDRGSAARGVGAHPAYIDVKERTFR